MMTFRNNKRVDAVSRREINPNLERQKYLVLNVFSLILSSVKNQSFLLSFVDLEIMRSHKTQDRLSVMSETSDHHHGKTGRGKVKGKT